MSKNPNPMTVSEVQDPQIHNPNNPFNNVTINTDESQQLLSNDKRIMNYNSDFNGNTNANNDIKHNNKRGASQLSTSFNIVKGLIGVGILCLPWAVSNIGLLPSILLITVSFTISLTCFILLCLTSDTLNEYTYRGIAEKTFGNKFAIAIDIILLIFLFLVCILYIVFLNQFIITGLSDFYGTKLIADFTLFGSSLLTLRVIVITVSVFIVLFPLSLCPRLDSLKYSSLIGIIGCLYTVGLVSFNFFNARDRNGYFVDPTVQWFNYHSNSGKKSDSDSNAKFIWFWLESFSVYCASFNTHFNAPALYGEMGKTRNSRKFIVTSSVSFLITLVVNFLIAICGYFTFGSDVAQNVLDSIDGYVVSIARFIMVLTIVGSYPLLFWNIKESLNSLVLNDPITKQPRKLSCVCSKYCSYLVVTVLIWLVAILTNDVGLYMSFMQSILGNGIIFILPPLMYLKAQKMSNNNKKNKHKFIAIKVLCYFFIIFGIIACVGGCVASIMIWVGYLPL